MSRYTIESIEGRYFVVDSACEGDDAYIGPYKWKGDAEMAVIFFEEEDAAQESTKAC
jgi:hypothetical protein